MRIDHLCAKLGGGAGIAARRLHDNLCTAGIESRMWYARDDDHNPASDASYHAWQWDPPGGTRVARGAAKAVSKLRKVRQKITRHFAMRGRPHGFEPHTAPWHEHATPWDVRERGSDLLNLHWMARALDYESFFASLPREFPVVWTMHDVNAFTGGCHYAADCEAFTTACGRCPQLGRSGANDRAAQGFRVKQRAYAGVNLHVVGPSRWMAEQAKKSALLAGARGIYHIPCGLDPSLYTPWEKAQARRELGLPADVPLVAFGAEMLTNRRKGFDLLLAALSRLAGIRRVQGLAFGGGELPENEGSLPPIHRTGYLATPAEQSLVYAAADVFVMPSREDNLPQTGLEALACGTPVVAFDIGGVPDYVIPGETGLLAHVEDVEGLARHIAWLLERPEECVAMGRRGRALIEREFAMEQVAGRYRSLYESILCASKAEVRSSAA